MKKVVVLGILSLILFVGLVSSSSTTSVGFSVGVDTQQQSQNQLVNFDLGIYMIAIFAAVFGFMMLKSNSKSKKKKKTSAKKKKSRK